MPKSQTLTRAKVVALDTAKARVLVKRADVAVIAKVLVKLCGTAEAALQKAFPGVSMSLEQAGALIDFEEMAEGCRRSYRHAKEADALLDEIAVAEPWEKLALGDPKKFEAALDARLRSFAVAFKLVWGVGSAGRGKGSDTTAESDRMIYLKWLALKRCTWGELRVAFPGSERGTLHAACRRQREREIGRIEGYLLSIYGRCPEIQTDFIDTF